MKFGNKSILAILLILALAFRFIGLGEHSLFSDEITWMVRGKELFFAIKQLNLNFFEAGWWLDKTNTEAIGLPIALLSGTMLVLFSPGQSRLSLGILDGITAARIPVALIGSLFIPLYYFLIKKYLGKKAAFIAAFLLAVDPVCLAISRWAQQDLMLLATSFLSLMLFIRSNSARTMILSSLAAALAILTKPQGILVAPTIAIYLFFLEKTEKKKQFIRFFKWAVLTGVITTAMFPFLWEQPLSRLLLYLKTQTGLVYIGQPVYFLGQLVERPPWFYYLIIAPFHFGEFVLFGIAAGLFVFFSRLKNRILKLNPFIIVSLIYSFLFFIIASWAHKKLGIRYLSPLWPYIFALTGFGITRMGDLIKGKWRTIYWTVFFVSTIFFTIKFYPSYYLFHNLLIPPKSYQELESVGFCDGIKPAMDYLSPRLHEGIKIMFYDCNFSADYYTGYTINHVFYVKENPEYVVVETFSAQKAPWLLPSLKENGYYEIKEIEFRGISLAKIYTK